MTSYSHYAPTKVIFQSSVDPLHSAALVVTLILRYRQVNQVASLTLIRQLFLQCLVSARVRIDQRDMTQLLTTVVNLRCIISNGMDSSSPYLFGVDAPEW